MTVCVINLCLLIFVEKCLGGLDTHEIFLRVLNRLYVPWFSDLERDYAHQESVCGYHTAVGKLIACERESRNAVGTSLWQ